MNTYIQNKLVEKFITENVANKYKEKTKTLFIQYYSLLSQNGNFEDIGKLDTIFKEIIEQSITDYHNHIVENLTIDEIIRIAKSRGFNIREKHINVGISQLDMHYDYTAIFSDPDFIKALQDTNPKE